MTAGDAIWGAIGLVADRVEAEIALPQTRGIFSRVLRNMMILLWLVIFEGRRFKD
jgi:hypothetical protein